MCDLDLIDLSGYFFFLCENGKLNGPIIYDYF